MDASQLTWTQILVSSIVSSLVTQYILRKQKRETIKLIRY